MVKNYSEQLIRKEFIRLLNKKAFNKITITEIVENCKLNRNTFYYHYNDLFHVLSEIFEDELGKITSAYFEGKTWKDTLLRVTQFARENKRAVFHVYHSLQREELERFLYNSTERILKKFVDDQSRDTEADDLDKKLIVKFFQMALTGMLIEWISEGMNQDINLLIDRMGLLLEGNIRYLLKNSESLKKLNRL